MPFDRQSHTTVHGGLVAVIARTLDFSHAPVYGACDLCPCAGS